MPGLPEDTPKALVVPEEMAGLRLDVVLSRLLPEYSRSMLTRWLKRGDIRLNERQGKPSEKVSAGDTLCLEVELDVDERWAPEPGELRIVAEDTHFLVVDKPPGLVTHPGAGNRSNTLANRLLAAFPELASVPRAGIVHRLDKDTSGLLVCARTLSAHAHLVAALQTREVSRQYLAIVKGPVTAGGTIDALIGRDPHHRTRMAVTRDGREAITHYRVRERFRAHTMLSVKLETGRTHQIRVHMAYISHPLLGDATYAARNRLAAGVGPAVREALLKFPRQALHAEKLAFSHPVTGELCAFESPVPDDLAQMLDLLREDSKTS